MCGLMGSVGAVGPPVEEALDRIAYRGPDARGVRALDAAIHGHVRLAIQDPDSRSDQPFIYRDLLLSYAGECWNRDLIRGELTQLGYGFETTGDTEVVAAALHAWGTDALDRLEGMFAMVWTRERHGTWLARDRWGKVPLYVLDDGLMGVAWASERRAFGGQAARAAPVSPGGWVAVNGGAAEGRWYPADPPAFRWPGVDRAAWVRDRLRRAVRDRLLADVPLCALCSGGLDSSLVLALAARERPDVVAYVARCGPPGPDVEAARRLTAELGVELREVEVPEPTPERVREAVEAIEIPTKVQVEIALAVLPLAEAIARDGHKVVLSGDGADELFGGYGTMARRASSDDAWRRVRVERVRKMGRADLIRANKAFMRHGVESRTPFLDRRLVEAVLSLGREECPPGKRLLKEAARGVLPDWVIDRDKETFQGGTGVAALCEELFDGGQVKRYNEMAREAFGALPRG